MKNIVVTTDFSACADNALHYAIELAKQLEAKLHVVYVYNTEVVVQTSTLDADQTVFVPMPISDEDYKKMNAVEKELENYPELSFECYIKEGFFDTMLFKLAENVKASMIVMGTKGAHDTMPFWSDSSNTLKILERKKIAVLSVPETYKGKLAPQCEFILATDFEQINDWSIMDTFYELALKLDAKINLFYVKDAHQNEEMTANEGRIFEELAKFFKGLHISLHPAYKADIVKAVDAFAHTKKASLVLMIAHERGWLDELFHHSITSDMTLHGHVPLLTIPDAKSELNKSYTASFW